MPTRKRHQRIGHRTFEIRLQIQPPKNLDHIAKPRAIRFRSARRREAHMGDSDILQPGEFAFPQLPRTRIPGKLDRLHPRGRNRRKRQEENCASNHRSPCLVIL